MNYVNAVLVKIDDDSVVVIDGVKYLVMMQGSQTRPQPRPMYKEAAKKSVAKLAKPKQKTRAKAKKFTNEEREALEASIFAILNAYPNSRSGSIRAQLKQLYNINVNPTTVSYALARMKKNNLIEVQGYKQGATWTVKKLAFNANVSDPNAVV